MLQKTKKVISKFTKDFFLKRNNKNVIHYLFLIFFKENIIQSTVLKRKVNERDISKNC